MKTNKKRKFDTVWKCPSCHYLIGDIEYKSARFNFPCTRCGKSKLSDFLTGDIENYLESTRRSLK